MGVVEGVVGGVSRGLRWNQNMKEHVLIHSGWVYLCSNTNTANELLLDDLS